MAWTNVLRVHRRNESAPTVLSSERVIWAASDNESYRDLPVKAASGFTSAVRKARH